MSILLDAPIRRLPWRGSDDPGLPVGLWMSSGTLVGDASGGTQRIRFQLGQEGVPISGEYFNLEQLSVLISEGTPRAGFLTIQNMTPGPTDLFDRVWPLSYLAMGGLNNSGINQGEPNLPIFVGARLRDSALPGSIAVGVTNLTATTSLSVSGMGYIWEPRSILFSGGIRRPADSIFGS